MPESSVQEAVLRLARQLKLIPTAPPGNPGPAYHPGPEWPVQSLSDAASVPAQFFGELLRGLMDPLGANNQAPVENIGALLGAAMPLAGGLRGLRAGQLAEEAATAGRAAKGAQGIKAYHGSPHDFDQFSLSKIGTGEGAQAYGHGLYFAENEGVAKTYRDALAQKVSVNGQPLLNNNKTVGTTGHRYLDDMLIAENGDIDKVIQELRKDVAESASYPYAQSRRDVRGALALAEDMKARNAVSSKNTGRMYEVQINANPDHLLDWDAPLSQQGKVGQKVAKSLKPNVWEKQQIEGAEKTLREYPQTKKYQQDPAAGEEYLDRVREHLAGLTNYKVATGQEAWERTMSQNNMVPTAASEALRKRGIPGIKYLDGGSRASGEGSRNFVIFDDSLVSILKKYGVALPMIEALRRKATTNNGTVPATDVHGLIGS